MRPITKELLNWLVACVFVAVVALISFYVSRRKTEQPQVETQIALETNAIKKQDFMMDSPTAVSNAVRFNAPPEGWDIVCNRNQMFAPRSGTFTFEIYDLPNWRQTTIRTSRFEAVVAAWRIKEMVDVAVLEATTKVESTNVWNQCDSQILAPTNYVETSVGLKLEFSWSSSGPTAWTNPVSDKEYGVQLIGNKTNVLSCGNLITFEPGITIPTTNVPCPCGNTNHWLWYFKSE